MATEEAPLSMDLQGALEKNLIGAQEEHAQSLGDIGISGPMGSREALQEKGLRVAGKTVARQQLQEALQMQDNTINKYITTAKLKDQHIIGRERDRMHRELNKVRHELMQAGMKMKFELNKARAKAKEKAQLGATMGSIAGALVMGYFTGGVGAGAGAAAGGYAGAKLASGSDEKKIAKKEAEYEAGGYE